MIPFEVKVSIEAFPCKKERTAILSSRILIIAFLINSLFTAVVFMLQRNNKKLNIAKFVRLYILFSLLFSRNNLKLSIIYLLLKKNLRTKRFSLNQNFKENFFMQFQFILLFLFFGLTTLSAQQTKKIVFNDTPKSETIDPLRPAKAAFYSAIFPGLGQIYNKKYWKLPLVYGAIGASAYFYIDSQKSYNIYRDEYKSRLAGNISNSEHLARLSDSQLISAQKQFQRNRDLSALFIVGFYVLNIIDANIDAALSQFNVSENLAFKPAINFRNESLQSDFGFACTYSF